MAERTLHINRTSLRFQIPIWILGLLITICSALLIDMAGAPMAVMLAAFAPTLLFVYVTIHHPRLGLLAYVLASFFVLGINRYIPGPLGLSIDGLLALSWVGVLFGTTPEERQRMKNPLTYFMLAWFLYTLIELINPEVRSRAAWFFAVRGLSVYFVIAVPIVLAVAYRYKDFVLFMRLYFVLCIITALWGFKQKYMGVDSFEQAWLDAGANTTHILFGRLRVFSFLSDAGQFGALMAHATVIAFAMGTGGKSILKRASYYSLAGFFMVALSISGSRGPVIIVFGGVFMYVLLIQNFRLLVFGVVLGASAFSALKYTSIGSGIYEIQRIRTALDPNDASFQVRLENQKKLRKYLANKPLGGGIGSGGNWGQRFSPGSYLSEVPYDSWFVKVWVETGIVGLTLYIILILIMLILGYRYILQVQDESIKRRLVALYAGYFGIVIGSYGNQIYGQVPISCIVVFSLCYIFTAPSLEEQKTIHDEETAARIPNYS